MSEPGVLTIHTDGAARGNPGPAAYAYIIEREGAPPIEEASCLGEATNNVAEYTALVRALERAAQLGGKHLVIHSDSELMVKQMNGQYQVKNEELRVLYDRARQLSRQFDSVKIQHVRREQNSRADRLCNLALDGGPKTKSASSAKLKPVRSRDDSGRQERVRQDAVECLRAVAAAWARGNPNDPRPEDVWEQLWTILEEGGVLRPARPRR
jgi:ribonuclease HI